MKRIALLPALLLILLPLAACQPNAPPSESAEATSAPTPADNTPSAAAQAAAASADAGAGATTAAAQPITAATDPPAAEQAPSDAFSAAGPALIEGTDYVRIPGGHPYQPLNGKVEVVEVFGYVCPACARFQPILSAWERQLPADVRFTYVPAPFGPEWIPYARAFYVAEAQGLVAGTHDAIFQAIHLELSLPGEGKKPDENAIANFYGKHGADSKAFLSAMHSFTTDAKINRGKQFMIRSGADGTPTIIVDGKYRVLGKTYPDMLRITDQLIARERASPAGAAQ